MSETDRKPEKDPMNDAAPGKERGASLSAGKKVLRFLTSMKFAVILLVVLAAACAGASLITQGLPRETYVRQYGERGAGWIMALRLDDAFHSWWFIVLTAFLCLNLLFCNLVRIRPVLRRIRQAGDPSVPFSGNAAVFEQVKDPEKAFEAFHLRPVSFRTAEGGKGLYAARNRIGYCGAWICHLGILVLILGFALGQMTQENDAFYGVPGDVRRVGDTGLFAGIDDFQVLLREDGTVEQYVTKLTVYDMKNGESRESGTVSVNHPGSFFGRSFYQNSTGWAARVRVLRDGEEIMDRILCTGEMLAVADKPDLVVMLNAFYPDCVYEPGMMAPRTASGELKNPGYLYSAYYRGNMLGMDVLTGDDYLTVDEYQFIFCDPQQSTLIAVKKDDFTWLALAGGLITTLGLFLAFYLQPGRIRAEQGKSGAWTVCAESDRGRELFRERIAGALKKKEETDGE